MDWYIHSVALNAVVLQQLNRAYRSTRIALKCKFLFTLHLDQKPFMQCYGLCRLSDIKNKVLNIVALFLDYFILPPYFSSVFHHEANLYNEIQ